MYGDGMRMESGRDQAEKTMRKRCGSKSGRGTGRERNRPGFEEKGVDARSKLFRAHLRHFAFEPRFEFAGDRLTGIGGIIRSSDLCASCHANVMCNKEIDETKQGRVASGRASKRSIAGRRRRRETRHSKKSSSSHT